MSENRDKIRALSDREQAREKLPIFYGSRENYLHGFKEVLGNSVDEVSNNFKSGEITIILDEDLKSLEVIDTGRGIPIFGETDGVENSTLLFETLFAGTNYENKDNGKIAVGTNGVGVTVLNFTSEQMWITSFKEDFIYTLMYSEGGLYKQPIVKVPNEMKRTGTSIRFRLDPKVYTSTIYNPSEVESIVKHIAATANNITFTFVHGDYRKEYKFDSLTHYFEEISSGLTCKHSTASVYKEGTDSIQAIFASSPDPIQESYLNMNWLVEHGTIHDGIIAGVRNFVNGYATNKKLVDKKTNITTSDVEDSVTYVASVLSADVEYANQTKLSTNKKTYRALAMKYVKSILESWEHENPKELEKFVKHIVEVNKFNSRNTAAKQKLKKQLGEKVDSISNRVEKLVECDKLGPNSELFVAEGDSAKGSVVLARDSEFQAAYPLRGKILNCVKADYLKIFDNKVIVDLIKTIGTGVIADKKYKDMDSFDIKKSNYGKIIIATDADPDGQQIACLIITVIYRLMRPLLDAGMIYIAQTPLYEIKLEDDSMIYIFSEKEKEEKLSKIKGKYTIARCKGLGELEPETMAYTAMNPETRELIQVTAEDAEDMIKTVEQFMGVDIELRRGYIEDNLYKYIENVD